MYAQSFRSFFLLFPLVLTLFPAIGQSGNPSINPALLTKSWPARWIAPPGVSLTDYGVYHFRRTIDLSSVPGSFVLHVSADNRYQLFLNGELVSSQRIAFTRTGSGRPPFLGLRTLISIRI